MIEEIERLKKELSLRLDDFAVLYRTNAQSRALEEAFLKAGVAYKIIGGVKFYQRKEIKDILAYLYFIQNQLDRASFERIVNVPARGIGSKTVAKIFQVAEEKKCDILSAVAVLVGSSGVTGPQIAPSKAKVLKDFVRFVEKMRLASQSQPVSKLIERVYHDSGYQNMLAKAGEEGQIRHENVQELLTVAKKFDGQESGLQAFLEEVALVSQVDRDLEGKEMVPLMTLHAAKGLEYEVIFMAGMEEGLLPHSRAILSEPEMEEERRLCYVGITRAKQKAHLLYTSARNIYGSTQISARSRFVDEIDDHLFEVRYAEDEESNFFDDDEGVIAQDLWKRRANKKGFIKKPRDIEMIDLDEIGLEQEEPHDVEFRDGDRVSHPEFGQGIVVSQDETTVSIAFAGTGLKKLAKGVAPLKKI